MYISTYMCVYIYLYTHRHTRTYFFGLFLIKGPELRQEQVEKLLGWGLCDQGSSLSSCPSLVV